MVVFNPGADLTSAPFQSSKETVSLSETKLRRNSSTARDDRSFAWSIVSGSLLDFIADQVVKLWEPVYSPSTVDKTRRFVAYVVKEMDVCETALLASLVYMLRLKQKFVEKDLSTQNCSRQLFVVCLLTATKYLYDIPNTNVQWATASELNLSHINCMELELLDALSFNVSISDLQLDWARSYGKIYRRVNCNKNISTPYTVNPSSFSLFNMSFVFSPTTDCMRQRKAPRMSSPCFGVDIYKVGYTSTPESAFSHSCCSDAVCHGYLPWASHQSLTETSDAEPSIMDEPGDNFSFFHFSPSGRVVEDTTKPSRSFGVVGSCRPGAVSSADEALVISEPREDFTEFSSREVLGLRRSTEQSVWGCTTESRTNPSFVSDDLKTSERSNLDFSGLVKIFT
eukprot:CFRG2499T1